MPSAAPVRRRIPAALAFAMLAAACGAGAPGGAAPRSADPAVLSDEPLEKPDMILVVAAALAIDAGNTGQAIDLLQKLARRRPGNRTILHELALAYRVQGEPRRAIEVLGPYEEQLGALSAASLGSAHSEAGDLAGAMAVIGRALERFPDSGLLHSEIGTVLARAGKLLEALAAYEKGIEVEPSWPSNYYHAAQIYSDSDHRGYTLIYGEMFRILEPGSERSEKLAILMIDTMREAVTIEKNDKGEISMQVSLAPDLRVKIDRPPGGGKPGGSIDIPLLNAFEVSYGVCLFDVFRYGVSIGRLHEARDRFLDAWWAEGSLHDRYDFPLADWLRRLRDAGNLEAYEYWLYGPAFPLERETWAAGHEADLERLGKWMADHPLFPPEATEGRDAPDDRLRAGRFPVARPDAAVRYFARTPPGEGPR